MTGQPASVTMHATLTSYWPWDVHTEAERRMEGEPKDRRGHRLHTLQEHRADPIAHPYCSVAGDFHMFPYGQRIKIPAIDAGAIFRVVDTGGHFFGKGKVIRNPGCEPLDICVQNRHYSIGLVVAEVEVMLGDDFIGKPSA